MTNVVNVKLARPATDVPISTNCVGMCARSDTSDVLIDNIMILLCNVVGTTLSARIAISMTRHSCFANKR